MPISEEEFSKMELGENSKIKPEYDQDQNICKNICMSKLCKSHTIVNTRRRISHHLAIYENYPTGFHLLVKVNREKSVDEIFKMFCEENKLEEDCKEYFNYTLNEVKEYIKLVKHKYVEILSK